MILNELQAYDPKLLLKPRWLVLNKIDLISDLNEREQVLARIVKELNWQERVFPISAICKNGTEALCYALMSLIDELKELSLDN